MSSRIAILLARLRMAALLLLAALLTATGVWHILPGGWLGWAASGVFMAAFVFLVRAGTLRRAPIAVCAPVRGRWLAVNSPATRVPSHGVQTYGQTYAIDLVFDPPGGGRPGTNWWPLAHRPAGFPGYGQPVLAPAGGVVVRAHDAQRDHWSRTSPAGLLYLFTVEQLREFFGPSRILGNHVVLDLGGGVYALFAHLRRHSVRVARGQKVTTGEQIAECGNSGNTSEPHLHFQLMDHPSVLLAAGLPVAFRSAHDGPPSLPGSGRHLLADRSAFAPQPIASAPALAVADAGRNGLPVPVSQASRGLPGSSAPAKGDPAQPADVQTGAGLAPSPRPALPQFPDDPADQVDH